MKENCYYELYNKYVKPFKLQQIFCFAILLMNAMAGLVYPIFLKLIIDDAIGNKDLRKLILFAASMMVNIVLIMLFGFLQKTRFLILGQNINFEIKKHIIQRLQGYSMEFFKKYQSGEILSIIENDAGAAHQLATTMIGELLVNSITIIGLGVILFQMDFQIALLSLVLVGVFTYVQRKFGASIKMKSTQFSIVKGELYSTTQEFIFSINDVIMLNCENLIKDKYYNKHKQYFESERKIITTKSYSNIFGNFFQSLALLMVICVGGYKVLINSMTIGTLFSLTIYIQKIYMPINSLAGLYVEFKKIEASLKRVFELINNRKGVIQDGVLHPQNDLNGEISFKNVSFGYDEGELLSNVNMKIDKGDKVALLGENGSGKTSILRLLLRICDYSGTILIDGYNLKDYKLEYLRKNMICIGQKPFIFHGSIKENILLNNNEITLEELKRILDKVCLSEDINNMPQGVDTIIGEKGVILSGGQAQKIGLARIFVLRPSILILDEPTSSLDLRAEEEICGNIFNEFNDKTIITVTHRREILKYCTKIFEIDGKNVIEKTERRAI